MGRSTSGRCRTIGSTVGEYSGWVRTRCKPPGGCGGIFNDQGAALTEIPPPLRPARPPRRSTQPPGSSTFITRRPSLRSSVRVARSRAFWSALAYISLCARLLLGTSGECSTRKPGNERIAPTANAMTALSSALPVRSLVCWGVEYCSQSQEEPLGRLLKQPRPGGPLKSKVFPDPRNQFLCARLNTSCSSGICSGYHMSYRCSRRNTRDATAAFEPSPLMRVSSSLLK